MERGGFNYGEFAIFESGVGLMSKHNQIVVLHETVRIQRIDQDDYISLTDIARYKNADDPRFVIQNWMRSRSSIEFLGIWELLNNPDFNRVEFDTVKNQSGSNAFVMTPTKWTDLTGAIGINSKAGRYGGTYAHKDIAFEFASWVSVEFKLYLIKEFQRLKDTEYQQLGWDIRRNLTKINYRIHTDAIKSNLIPPELTPQQSNLIYASEADVLNMALFGKTAKQWRDETPGNKGNIRDEANASQLVCLANLETLNAHFSNQGLVQSERITLLNRTAIQQMKLLSADADVRRLEGKQP